MSKKRSPNFTSQEIQILTDEVEKNKSLLFSRLTNTATNSAKKRGWEAVCSKMNAVNDTDHLRTVEEIRKKWTCYVSSTKKKLAENKRESRRTGGGPPPNAVSSVEEKVAGIIGKTPINGIKGGIDTCVAASFEEEDSCASVSSPEKSKRLSSSSSSILQGMYSYFLRINYMTNRSIVDCVTSSGKYFRQIEGENQFLLLFIYQTLGFLL